VAFLVLGNRQLGNRSKVYCRTNDIWYGHLEDVRQQLLDVVVVAMTANSTGLKQLQSSSKIKPNLRKKN
jgi:hypothetical protein